MRGIRTRRARGLLVAALAGASALVLAACDPILHPNVTVREPAGSTASLLQISGNSRYALVTASGPAATVPAAGWWRVDRDDGSTVQLPDGFGQGISVDGSRILGNNAAVWVNGVVRTPPPGTLMAADLTFGVFVDTDGFVKTWETETQAVTDVEPGFPRPPGFTTATAVAISDDGRTVQYELRNAAGQLLDRFADLDAGVVIDRSRSTCCDVDDSFVLATGGGAFMHVHEVSIVNPPDLVVVWSAEIVRIPEATVSARVDSGPGGCCGIDRAFLSANGRVGWFTTSTFVLMHFPAPIFCPAGSSATAFMNVQGHVGKVEFSTGLAAPSEAGISANGRFLLFKHAPVPFPCGQLPAGGSVTVYDWAARHDELLLGPSDLLVSRASVSADLRLVATSSPQGGWFEFASDPPG